MADTGIIATSTSKSKSWEKCPRLRWWEYEAPSGKRHQCSVNVGGCGHIVTSPDGHGCDAACPNCGKHVWVQLDGTRGWEPARLNLPLSTGGWCHKIVQALLEGQRPAEAILLSVQGYRDEVQQRGIELGLQLDGAIAEEKFLERTIQEQAALIEAFGWAFVRVRLPRILAEYEVLSVEQEEQTALAGDVVLQSRCDAVFRRRADGRVFVYNLKTSKDPHRKSWQDQWQYDQQMMTEVLAVERRLGERVYGVIVDGFDKGERVTCWWHNLKEIREGYSKPPAEGEEKWQRQRSRLLYGYKCEETIPGRPTLYDFEGTTRKGWGPFSVWEEKGWDDKSGLRIVHAPEEAPAGVVPVSPVEYWLNWLPIEQVESVFVTLPPVLRLDEVVDRRVRQVVKRERGVQEARQAVEAETRPEAIAVALDEQFPQSSGYQCQFCSFKRVCWEGVEPSTSPDLYRPRQSNHPELEGE